MIKPIAQPLCSRALNSCFRLQMQFAAWLCNPAIGALDVTAENLSPPTIPTEIEASWLWGFLQREVEKQPLITRAQVIASMATADKNLLCDWIVAVCALEEQFQPDPSVWPISGPAISPHAWKAFKELMEAFYKKGFYSGLPYSSDGSPTAEGGVTYHQFVEEFRSLHRLHPNPDAREVCVLCGGPLDDIEVDHWIVKSNYPLLSVRAVNLLPACGKCNSSENKGTKQVHTDGSFEAWFHPYLRHANGSIKMDYNTQTRTISISSTTPSDDMRVRNIDTLLNLTTRWTREIKAEYVKQQDDIIRREKSRVINGEPRHTQAEVISHIQQINVSPTEPHYELHLTLLNALLVEARLDSWQTELGLV